MTLNAPEVSKQTDFTGFSYITPKVAWMTSEIQIGAWMILCFFAPEGYIECRKTDIWGQNDVKCARGVKID